MPIFVDPRSGEVFQNVPPEEEERARREFGLVTEDEYDQQIAVKEADKGVLSAAGKGLQSGLGLIQDIARGTGLQPQAGDAFGPGGGMLPAWGEQPPQAAPLPPGAETFPAGFDEQARLEREAHPIAFGAGQGLASAPFAAIAGAAGGAVGGPAVLGASLLGVGAEAATEGAFQEYSDAYFEQRPFELKKAAANTLMFSGLDFAFRGALKGIGTALGGKPAKPGALGSRNVVSEAQGAAREFVDPVGGGSVGAARAADLEEPFVDAIKQMSDRDAAVLARDADDHLHLISQDASEAFTRLNNGLSEDLGSQLKYEDIGTYAQEWDPATVVRQERWWGKVSDEATAGIQALESTPYELGNIGKRALSTLDTFWRRVSDEVDPGQRMVVIDEFKKRLDRMTKSVDASDLDSVAKDEIKSAIAPTRETLRRGLENKKLFGGAADLQRSLNAPWHGLLEHWGKVQNTLTEATGHIKFDVSGAGRISRESTVDRMFALLGKDPRSNQEFGRHLAGALENVQGLIDARQAYGIARKDGLDALESDIRNLMEDWNLAQTVGVAKNRTAALKRDPRKWATLALNLGERLPMVGQPIQLARTLGDAFTDLHINRKTPLGRVWDTAYQRYAGNAAFQDPAVIGSYSPWVADALKNRGGKFMPPSPSGAVGSPAIPGMPPANANAQRSVAQPGMSSAVSALGGVAREHGSRALGAGGLAGAAALEDEHPGGASMAATAGLALLFPRGLMKGKSPAFKRMARIVAPIPADTLDMNMMTRIAERAAKEIPDPAEYGEFMGVLSDHFDNPKASFKQADGAVDYLAKQTGTAAGATRGGRFVGSDGVERYVKFMPKERALNEVGNAAAYDAFGVPSVKLQTEPLASAAGQYAKEGGRSQMVMSEMLDGSWNAFDKHRSLGAPVSTEMASAYVQGVPADIVLGNWDVAANGGNIMTNGKSALRIDVGEAGPNSHPGVFNAREEWHILEKSFGATRDAREPRDIVGLAGVPDISAVKGELVTGVARIEKAIAKAGGADSFVNAHWPHLHPEDAKTLAQQIDTRLQFVRQNVDKIAATVLATGFALSSREAQAAAPPPQQTPEHAYRDALREIGQAGDAHIKAIASDALRLKPRRGKDRDPLTLFAGKRKIQDAVEETRERLDEIAADPMTLLEQLGGSVGDIGKTHPSVYMALVEKAGQVATYLQSVIPQRTATTLLDPVGAAPSFDRAWDYAARFVGATQPRAALREVARGTAPPEMLEAVQQNWPEEWEAFQIETLGQVQRMHLAGRHIPSEKLRRLDSLLGLGGQLDPSASQEVTQHMLAAQDAELARREQGGQATGAMPSSGPAAASFRTRLDAINSERMMGA